MTPFTTPGHKRRPDLADDFLLLDLPLSGGADDLHMRSDVLGQAERLAADLWGADLCRFCGNGSTEGNQALALALGRPGDRAVISRIDAQVRPRRARPLRARAGLGAPRRRPCHRAAARAPGRAGRPRRSPRRRTPAASSWSSRASSASSPTSRAIAELAHGAGVPLVVDQAWGAHFGFHPAVPPHALAAGADAFVASSHKTLAAFTQSAFLLARGGFLDLERLDESFEILHTTSVSAALLASIDRARMIMATRGEELLGETVRLAAYVRGRLAEVEGLAVVDSDDPTKLALALPGTGADGLEVEADLFAQGIRFELANRDLLVPLLTIADTEEGVERLCDALVASFERRRGEPRPPGRRERRLGRRARDGHDPAGGVLLRAGDRPGRGRRRPRRRRDGLPVPARDPRDRPGRGGLARARRGAAGGRRRRHAALVLRRSGAGLAAGRRAARSRASSICYKEA